MDAAIHLSLLRQLIQAELREHSYAANRDHKRLVEARRKLEETKRWFNPENTADPNALKKAEAEVKAAHEAMIEAQGFSKGFEAGLKQVQLMIEVTLNDARRR